MLKTLAFGVLASGVAAEEAVITGTQANFEKVIADAPDGALVEFYAPWCGHCKKLAPEWEKAAQKLKDDGSKTPLVKVDATVESKLGEKYGVNGYPTIKWFVGGSASDYDGPREADGIVSWVKSMTGPAVVESAPTGEETFSVTFYGDSMDDFEAVAKANRKKASWFFVKEAGSSKVVLKHVGEDATTVETADKAAIEAAFKAAEFPLYGELNGDTFSKFMEKGEGMVWTLLEMTAENAKATVEESRAMMTAVAKKLSEDSEKKMAVTHTNTVEFKKVLESMFGITEFPRVVVQTKVGDKKNFIYDGEMSEEKILEFVTKVKSGEIKANLKSEEIPAEPQESPVKVIVGKTVESMVFSATKDVLLEVYAPWCGHCKKLEPEYIKVGKKVQKEGFEDILTIAKMDGTLNDSPVDSISWSGFPTLYYVKAGSSEPMKYDGARDAKGIWKWIKKNHSQGEMIREKIANKQAKKEEAASKKEDKTEEAKKEEL